MQAMLYQPMVSSNIVRLEGAVDFYSVMHCISQLTVASFSCRAITLVLSTGGGFVAAALALYRHMETMKQLGFHITVICPDMVASAGTLILQAASLRILREGTSFGMHKPFALCPHEQLYHQYGVSDIPCNDACRHYNKCLLLSHGLPCSLFTNDIRDYLDKNLIRVVLQTCCG